MPQQNTKINYSTADSGEALDALGAILCQKLGCSETIASVALGVARDLMAEEQKNGRWSVISQLVNQEPLKKKITIHLGYCSDQG